MTRIIALILLLLSSTQVYAQALPIANPGSFIRWEYVQVDITRLGITQFQSCLWLTTNTTNKGCSMLPVSSYVPPASEPSVVPGNLAFKTAIPTLPVGNYTVSIAACTSSGCGLTVELNFVFALTNTALPVTNIIIVK